MKTTAFKNCRVVRSSWLEEGGRRLDCNPYMSGAQEARDALQRLSARKEHLGSLCAGIFHAGREGRLWVYDERYGVPFLGSSDIRNADLEGLPLLSKQQVARNSNFSLGPDWTLITRSGTIGRMAYVRPDMVGMACSEHVLRVVPNTSAIDPGYLYAFLSSQFGVPLVVSGTYGAIIQHIEPEHIAGIPVPRLGSEIESKVHSLIVKAAKQRAEASLILRQATEELLSEANLPVLKPPSSPSPYSISKVEASSIQPRFDAFFHSQYRQDAVKNIGACGSSVKSLSDIAFAVEEPNRFKRIVLDINSGGVPLFGTSAIFWNDPEPSYYLPKKMAVPYLVTRKTVLIPRSGQLTGVIGRPVLPYGDIIGGAVSEDAIRVHCHNEIDAGFLFIFLSSEYGTRQLKARAFGSSIPHLDVRQIGACIVPKLQDDVWSRIGLCGLQVSELRGDSIVLEHKARELVEHEILKGRT